MIRRWVFIFLMFLPLSAQAKSYKPGSVGYLYDSCANMLAEGERLEDVYQTYCAAFLEGFFAGASVSNWIDLPPPQSNDPCATEKARAYEHINARVCPHFPNYMDKSVTPEFMITTASAIVQRWIAFNLKSDKNFLKRRAADVVGDLIQPGAFCDSLLQKAPGKIAPMTINPALLGIKWESYLKIQNDVTLERKYQQCKNDLAQDRSDPKFSFAVSWCGGEIEGYIAGLRATSKLQEGRKENSKACAKPIDRLYKSLDVTRSMCVSKDVKSTDVAEIFLKRFEQGITKDAGFANLKTLGAVGYETIYRGFLCVP
jgi:hypothetical protein